MRNAELPRTATRLRDLISAECESEPLGMESGAITNAQITASSQWNSRYIAGLMRG